MLASQNWLRVGIGQVERRFTFRISQLCICSMLQKWKTNVDFALADWLMEWSVIPVITRVWIGSSIEENINNFRMSKWTSAAKVSREILRFSTLSKRKTYLWSGFRPPSSFAAMLAPFERRNSTTSFLPYPLAKWSAVDRRPAVSTKPWNFISSPWKTN